jgi:hypothetical protein
MFGKKGLDLAQHRHTIFLSTELMVRIRDGYEPVRLPSAFQSRVHVFGLLQWHLGVRIAVEHQQGNVEFGRMQSGRIELELCGVGADLFLDRLRRQPIVAFVDQQP